MKQIKIKAKIRSDFVFFMEINNKDKKFKEGKLKRDDFFNWLKEKSKIYDKVILLMENDELIIAKREFLKKIY